MGVTQEDLDTALDTLPPDLVRSVVRDVLVVLASDVDATRSYFSTWLAVDGVQSDDDDRRYEDAFTRALELLSGKAAEIAQRRSSSSSSLAPDSSASGPLASGPLASRCIAEALLLTAWSRLDHASQARLLRDVIVVSPQLEGTYVLHDLIVALDTMSVRFETPAGLLAAAVLHGAPTGRPFPV